MPLIAYDRQGNVICALDFLVNEDEDGTYRLVDLEGTEAAGTKLRELWEVSGASGSTTWPEYLGERFPEFRVQLDRRFKHAGRRLVHRRSGVARDRVAVEDAIVARKEAARQEAKAGRRPRFDLRPVIGSPMSPIVLDDTGRDRGQVDGYTPPTRPVLRGQRAHGSPSQTVPNGASTGPDSGANTPERQGSPRQR